MNVFGIAQSSMGQGRGYTYNLTQTCHSPAPLKLTEAFRISILLLMKGMPLKINTVVRDLLLINFLSMDSTSVGKNTLKYKVHADIRVTA